MPRSPSKPRVEPEEIDRLAEAVETLTQQLRQLVLVLDEVREDIIWTVRNHPERLNIYGPAGAPAEPPRPPIGHQEKKSPDTNPPLKEPVVPPKPPLGTRGQKPLFR